ncbi:MAG: methyltransferase family protein [Mangrovicoccus sp.]
MRSVGSMPLALIIACIGAAALFWLWGIFLHALFRPASRRWPPRRFTWAIAVEIWALASLAVISCYALASLAPGGLVKTSPALSTFGWALVIGGGGLSAWGMASLGLAQTSGAPGPICKRGPYRWLRHPQYWGHSLALLGWLLVTGSLAAMPLILGVIAAFALAGMAENRAHAFGLDQAKSPS